MRKRITLLGALLCVMVALPSAARDADTTAANMDHHSMHHAVDDGRIALGLSPTQRQHQLSNMRSHLEAVRSIVALIAENKFEQASQTAHEKLGLTEEMKKMCDMFKNESFRELGLAFHNSGDELGDALLSKDTGNALQALNATMGYCVECHAKYRQ